MFATGFILGLLGFAVVFATRSLFRVDEGHVAVLTSFGAALRDRSAPERLRIYRPGLHRKWPWQRPLIVSMMEQSLELSGEKGGQMAMAEDGTVLRRDSILRFRPVEEELSHFLFDLRSPLDHVTGLFSCLLRNEIANFRRTPGDDPRDAAAHAAEIAGGGAYALIRRERKQLNARIEEFCEKQIGRRYGVRFSAVDLTDILPPDELADALNAVISASTEAESRYARAEADARQRLVAAERGVAIARERAAAHEEEVRAIVRVLEPMERDGTLAAYVRRRRAEVLSQCKSLILRSVS